VLGLHDMMVCVANFAELLLREFAKRWGILSAMKSLPRRQKRPVGRSTSYRREYCARIIKAMASGLSAEAAAAKIGISARSLFYWQREHPEFLQAIQEGRQQGLLWWEKRAQAMAKGKPGNTQIVMLALRNRSRAAHGWNNETLKVEHSAAETGPVIDARQLERFHPHRNQEGIPLERRI
jgi:hypothetical protein